MNSIHINWPCRYLESKPLHFETLKHMQYNITL
jgi:hypothetical protein